VKYLLIKIIFWIIFYW